MDKSQEPEAARILIVDDDRLIRRMLTIALQKDGYLVVEAESGEQALEMIAETPPDMALLDITLDGMSGIELARRLRNETEVPFMFITTHDENEFVSSAIGHGALGYLVKPIESAALTPALKVALSRAREIKALRHAEANLSNSVSQIQEKLVQSDKLASIGQLAAGVAHEINNPIGYVGSNIRSLEGYIKELFAIVDAYAAIQDMAEDSPARQQALEKIKGVSELPFLREDIPALLDESKEGIKRVRQIVQDLKDFSHVESSNEWQWTNLHKGLDSTLNVINNEIKYRAEVVREYGEVPDIECLPGPLNQVFMNLLVNAAHAMPQSRQGRIVVRTGVADEMVWVEIADNGSGISPENLARIFDPFFTTKPLGQGTGLGLSLSQGIVQKHGGTIEVESREGEGTRFRVVIPQRQTDLLG